MKKESKDKNYIPASRYYSCRCHQNQQAIYLQAIISHELNLKGAFPFKKETQHFSARPRGCLQGRRAGAGQQQGPPRQGERPVPHGQLWARPRAVPPVCQVSAANVSSTCGFANLQLISDTYRIQSWAFGVCDSAVYRVHQQKPDVQNFNSKKTSKNMFKTY